MRIMLSAGACLIALFISACGDGGGGSGGKGGSTASGGAGGETATGGSATGGSGGTGGSTATGGAGGNTSSGGTGGAGGMTASGGAGGSTASGAAFGQPCTMDSDCVEGLLCYNFQAKGMLCTKACQSAADCPAPSSGCNGMGYCKPN